MSRRNRYLARIILVGVVLIVGVGLYDRLLVNHWVGNTDLTIEFVVTDAATGQPIEGAEILIAFVGGLNDDGARARKGEPKEEALKLTTEKTGTAGHVRRGSVCFGSTSGLGVTDTYGVHLPWWRVTTTRPGYTTAEPFHLNELTYRRAVKRDGPQQAKLVVPIALRKSQP